MIQDNTKELIGALEAACRKRITKADGSIVPLTRQAEKVQFRGWGPNFESDITEVPDRVGTMFALDQALRGTPEMMALQALMSSKEQVFQRARDPTAPPIPAEQSLSQARYWIIADIVDGILAGDASDAMIERVSEKFEATFLLERPYLVEFPVINLRIEREDPLVLGPRLRLRKLEVREREDLVTYASIFRRMDVETVGHIEWALEMRFDLDPSGPTMYIQSNKIAQAVLTLLRLLKSERVELGGAETKPLHYRDGRGSSTYAGRRHMFIADACTVSLDERPAVIALWSAVGRGLIDPGSQSLGLATRRFRDASERAVPADALVDYVICMEALLLAGFGQKTRKTTGRFVQRGAAILGGSKEERTEARKRLERFYDLRSEVVHGRNDFTDGAELRRLRETARTLLLWYLRQPSNIAPAQIGTIVDKHARVQSPLALDQFVRGQLASEYGQPGPTGS